MQCPRCAKETPEGSIVCPFCASPLGDEDTPTPASGEAATPLKATSAGSALEDAPTLIDDDPGKSPVREPEPRSTSRTPAEAARSLPDSNPHGRFLPGTMVAERYRIVGLLGRGGMGEVYRADDLKLGQQVALKFLSRKIAADPAQVELLFDEVRMARKVSHPNVCRVWDVGETDGHHYVSMEYVDGEDLASLLRRIGRLPEDKASEISRQLCAALAAAHDEGVLHRDLKPANIMLDGRGRVKLTDFGLAGVAEVRAGTPMYMAPEQIAGEGVSVKSDLYSLGLVLYELFTGKKVFEAASFEELAQKQASDITTSLTNTGRLDPAIERLFHRCLERDPAKRPASALAVAAALPGADPLAAALAAGETPSPEMVAEAGGEGTLPLRIAVPLLLLAILGAIAVGVLQANRSLISWVPFDASPTALDIRAEQILSELEYSTEHRDVASSFTTDLAYIHWLRSEDAPPERWETVALGRPASVVFWWRSSPEVLVPFAGATSAGQPVSLTNPPLTTPGMIGMQLDTLGNLLWLEVVPERVAEITAADATGQDDAVDWSGFFDLMGLDIEAFVPVAPRLYPDHFVDARAAWEGAHPGDPEVALRIEAASLAGRPTSLRMFTPYNPFEKPTTAAANSGLSFAAGLAIAVLLIIILSALTAIFGGLYVAQRNWRAGRGDVRGARRLGFAMASALAASWLFGSHTYSLADINDFIKMLMLVCAMAGITWALYLAVEPFMRRHAPEALIGWTRFLDGRFADSLVGRDLLIGCATGALSRLLTLVPMAAAERSTTAGAYIGLPHASVLELAERMINDVGSSLLLALGLLFLYSITFLALGRRPWAALLVWLVIFGALGFLPGIRVNGVSIATTPLTSVFWTINWALWLYVLFRRGILAFLVMATTSWLLAESLPTLDFSSWYGSSMTAGLTLFLALTAYAFYRCVALRGGLADALVGE